jgi:hypothetical protein
VYGIIDGDEAGARLADRVRDALGATGTTGSVFRGPFRREGARVWWGGEHTEET